MLKPGTRVGGVLIHELVGRGAMGEVYRGEQVSLRRPVAVKRIAPHLADLPEVVARFEREARLVAALNTPHVVAVYDFGRYPDPDGEVHALLIMEWVPGGRSLGRVQAEMDWRQATTAIRQIAGGLAVAHAAGVTHRDIKPDNILLSADGTAKLADFGLATAADVTAMTREGSAIGTPNYMAPEACRSEPLGPSSDIYSLGAAWFHLLTGRPPFKADSTMALLLAHVSGPVPDPREHGADLPAPVAALVVACLAKTEEARPASARALCERLDLLSAEGVFLPADLQPLTAIEGGSSDPSTLGTALATDAVTRLQTGSGSGTLVATTAETAIAGATAETAIAARSTKAALAQPSSSGSSAAPTRRSRTGLIAAVVFGAVVAAGAALLLLRQDPLDAGRDRVQAALASGDQALAMTTADALIARHPDRPEAHAILREVVAHEVESLIAQQRFEQALAVIATRKTERSWLQIDAWDRAIRVAQVRTLLGRGNWRDSEDLMWQLIQDYPTDLALKRTHVELFGHSEERRASRFAAASARAVADATSGPLEPAIGETLLDGLLQRGSEDQARPALASLLATRYPQRSTAAAREWLHDVESSDTSTHGYFLLEAVGALSDSEALQYHSRMLFELSTSYRKQKERSMAWIRAAMATPDWEARKQAAGITAIERAPALDDWGDFHDQLVILAAEAYAPQLEAALLRWCADPEQEKLRWNAYRMLQHQGRLERLDRWDFHAQTLVTFDFGYQPESYRSALAFFTQAATGPRAAEVPAVLAAGRAYLMQYHQMWTERGDGAHYVASIERNLASLAEVEKLVP